MTLDDAMRIVGWNKALEALLGFSAGDVVGKTCWEAVAGRDVFGNPFCSQFCGVCEALARNEPVSDFEITMQARSGERVSMLCSTLVVRCDAARRIVVHLFHAAPDCREPTDRGNEHASQTPDAGSEKQKPSLTERQREVLSYLAEGWPNQAVAATLGISIATVRTHIQNILRKFMVHSLRQAIAKAKSHNLI